MNNTKLYITKKSEGKVFRVFVVVAKGMVDFRRALERLKELAGPDAKATDLIGKKAD